METMRKKMTSERRRMEQQRSTVYAPLRQTLLEIARTEVSLLKSNIDAALTRLDESIAEKSETNE